VVRWLLHFLIISGAVAMTGKVIVAGRSKLVNVIIVNTRVDCDINTFTGIIDCIVRNNVLL